MKTKTLEIQTNQLSRFETLVRDASRLEVEDAFFHTASAVFLPDVPGAITPGDAVLTPFTNVQQLADLGTSHPQFAADLVIIPFDPDDGASSNALARENGLHVILAALKFLEKNPAHQLVIAGHTDRAGDDAFNVRLSAARGRSVLAVLEGKRSDFVAACALFHVPEDDAVVLRFAARSAGFQTEPVDSSRAAPEEIREFQREFNDKFKASIRVSGVVGDETRGAYFDLYEADLAKSAGGKDALAKLRTQIRFIDAAHKVLGFGEKFPRENPGQDGLRSQLNRRVEFLFFSPPRLPKVAAPDVGEQIFKRKLFSLTALDRKSLADTTTAGGTVAAGATGMSVVPIALIPDDPLSLTMKHAGVRDPQDPYAFLGPFHDLHPDERTFPDRGNSINNTDLTARASGKNKRVPPPPGPTPNA